MTEFERVERIVQEAIGILETYDRPSLAALFQDRLDSIRVAPTRGAKERRVNQLREYLNGMGHELRVIFARPTEGDRVIRFRRSNDAARMEARYGELLDSLRI